MWKKIITLSNFSISIDEETDDLCKSVKEKAKKLAKLMETNAS